MAAPVISNVIISNNLVYDDETSTISCEVSGMATDDDIVLFEVVGQGEYIKLSTSDYTSYNVIGFKRIY